MNTKLTTKKGKVVIGSNIKKTSVVIDKNGKVLSTTTSASSADKIKKIQEARDKKLGL